jgi:hypothetical protein
MDLRPGEDGLCVDLLVVAVPWSRDTAARTAPKARRAAAAVAGWPAGSGSGVPNINR